MSALSIRKIPKELDRALRREAKRRRTTKTAVVLKALQSVFQLGTLEYKRKKVRDFFGHMSPSELSTFQKATGTFSQIDKDLWP